MLSLCDVGSQCLYSPTTRGRMKSNREAVTECPAIRSSRRRPPSRQASNHGLNDDRRFQLALRETPRFLKIGVIPIEFLAVAIEQSDHPMVISLRNFARVRFPVTKSQRFPKAIVMVSRFAKGRNPHPLPEWETCVKTCQPSLDIFLT